MPKGASSSLLVPGIAVNTPPGLINTQKGEGPTRSQTRSKTKYDTQTPAVIYGGNVQYYRMRGKSEKKGTEQALEKSKTREATDGLMMSPQKPYNVPLRLDVAEGLPTSPDQGVYFKLHIQLTG